MSARGLRALAVPGSLTVVGLAILIGLGVWQLDRKAWKEGLIDSLRQRLSAPAVAFPAPDRWNRLTQAADEFRRVRFRAGFLHAQEALVYTVGSALRPDVSGPGYWVFTPAKLADGAIVVVDRGFVPEGRRDPKARAAGQVEGTVEIVGALRWPEEGGWFAPEPDRARRQWFVRDHVSMAQALGWGRVAPFHVAQEAPVPPGGLPKPGRLTADLRNQHLQYALTWFGLAIVLASVFVFWVRARRCQPDTQ